MTQVGSQYHALFEGVGAVGTKTPKCVRTIDHEEVKISWDLANEALIGAGFDGMGWRLKFLRTIDYEKVNIEWGLGGTCVCLLGFMGESRGVRFFYGI